MSTSLLYHAFGVRDYRCVRTKYEAGVWCLCLIARRRPVAALPADRRTFGGKVFSRGDFAPCRSAAKVSNWRRGFLGWRVRTAELSARRPSALPNRDGATLTLRVMEQLIDQLEEEGSGAVVSALGQTLGRVRDPEILQTAASALTPALEDDSWNVRERAAIVLGELLSRTPDPATVDAAALALLVTLENHHQDVRAAAATALGKILRRGEDPQIAKGTIVALLETLEDDAAVVPRAGAGALGKAFSADVDPELGKRAVKLLVAMVEGQNSRLGGDLEAIGALGRIVAVQKSPELARTAVPPLIEAVQHKSQPYRFRASRALGRIISAVADTEIVGKIVPLLITDLQSKGRSLREHAAWALSQVDSGEARDALRNAGFDPDHPPRPPMLDY